VGVLLLLAGLLGLVLLLLAVPVNVDFRVEGTGSLSGQVRVRWMFGMVRIRAPFPRGGAPGRRPEEESRATRTSDGSEPRGRGRGRHVLAALRQATFRGRVYRLVGDLVRAIHVHRVRLRVRVGLGDPADTGLLWAVVGPVNAVAQWRDADIRIEPDFLEPVLEFHAEGGVAIVPLRFILPAIGFALSPPTIRAWRTLRGHRA
jgi:hypothetical protein